TPGSTSGPVTTRTGWRGRARPLPTPPPRATRRRQVPDMAVKSLGDYTFPSRSAQENYGEDQLVTVLVEDTMWFCSPVMFRAPRAMTWADLRDQVFRPFIEGDPDHDPSAPRAWTLHGEVF